MFLYSLVASNDGQKQPPMLFVQSFHIFSNCCFFVIVVKCFVFILFIRLFPNDMENLHISILNHLEGLTPFPLLDSNPILL